MRKIKPAEFVAISALMSIGSYAQAQDLEELPITNLNSVQVNATYEPPVGVYYFNDYPPDGGLGGGVSPPPLPSTDERAKVLRCINKYGKYKQPTGFTINYTSKFGWGSTTQSGVTMYTNTYTSPSSLWYGLAGLTTVGSNNTVWIFPPGYSSFKEHLITLEHELAHANGIKSETTAEQAGQDAYAAFVAAGGVTTNGANCN